MPNVVFKDESLEKEFNEKGYVKLQSLKAVVRKPQVRLTSTPKV